jgi:mono/diheme cytochrome c family protein
MTRKLITLGAILILIGLLFNACIDHPELPPNPQSWINDGEKVFVEYCSECHQRDGGGWLPLYPNFAGNPIVTLHDPEPIIVIVLYGQGSMPPFRERLNADQIAAVLSYIRNSWGNEAAAVSPRQVH